MSRPVGIVALVIAFACGGLMLWRISSPHLPEALPPGPKRMASLDSVQRDLCFLARAELQHQRKTGRYATLDELRSDGDSGPRESRWPYRYVLKVPNQGSFVIMAVAEEAVENQPRILQIDDQLRVQTRTHPVQVYPCAAAAATREK